MIIDFTFNLVNTILAIIKDLGYIGIFIGMTIESSFFPFPSEVILIPAGALVSQGQLNFFLVVLAGLLGSLLGASINYFIALFLGRKTVDLFVSKYGRFLFITKADLRKTDDYFKKHGEITTFVGRLIFVVRQFISLPAGFAKMNYFKFLLYTGLGAGIWVTILTLVGMLFGSEVSLVVKWTAGVLLLIALVTTLVYYKIKVKAPKKKDDDELV